MRSPIDIMIDRACGIDPGSDPAPHFVTMVCPKCKKRKRAPKHETDPAGTVEVHVACPGCNPGDFDQIDYFDADGNQLGLPE